MNVISGSYQKNQINKGQVETIKTMQSAQSTLRDNDIEKNKVHQKKNVTIDDIETVVESLNEFIEPTRTNLKFELHEKLNEYYVTVVDPTTKETIREIPPKKMLDMYAAMVEHMGLLVDKKI